MMRRLLLVLCILAVAGCYGETSRPTPTGKGSGSTMRGIGRKPWVSARGRPLRRRMREMVRARSRCPT